MHQRLATLLAAAQKVSDPEHALGREARALLVRSTGLSPAGVELALTRCLETRPSPAELEQLAARVRPAPRAHVLLSANVFVGVHRALALALAATRDVYVRASRREPEMLELFARATPGLFERRDALEPRAGERLYAYGTRETLRAVGAALPSGVEFHAHGPGFGLLLVESSTISSDGALEGLAEALARDVVAFDQRGCLSPRAVIVQGSRERSRALGEALARSLARAAEEVPLGTLSDGERAEIVRYQATLAYAGDALSAGSGWVGIAPMDSAFQIAPVGRNLHVLPCSRAAEVVARIARHVTTYGVLGSPEFCAVLRGLLPYARSAEPGSLQTPAFDGPVDLRPSAWSIGGEG